MRQDNEKTNTYYISKIRSTPPSIATHGSSIVLKWSTQVLRIVAAVAWSSFMSFFTSYVQTVIGSGHISCQYFLAIARSWWSFSRNGPPTKGPDIKAERGICDGMSFPLKSEYSEPSRFHVKLSNTKLGRIRRQRRRQGRD